MRRARTLRNVLTAVLLLTVASGATLTLPVLMGHRSTVLAHSDAASGSMVE